MELVQIPQQYNWSSNPDEFLNQLRQSGLANDIFNQPNETRLDDGLIKRNILNGLNMGNKTISDWQTANNIRKPQGWEEVALAKNGEFNPIAQTGTLNAAVQTSPTNWDRFAMGYRDNYDNGFAPKNLQADPNKNWATRLGEGLGTIGRFIDSPLGRGLMAAGLNKALGYDNSLQEGLTAAVGRQNAVTADKLYRNQLKQYGYTDDDLAQIRGNITSDVYRNLATNMYRTRNLDQNTYLKMKKYYDTQLQSGILSPEQYQANVEALNNQYMNSQIQTMQAGNVGISNQTRNANMNEQLLPYKQYALQMSPQIALGNLGVAQGNLGLRMAEFNYKQQMDALENSGLKLSDATKKAVSENAQTIADIDAGIEAIKNNPDAYKLINGAMPAWAVNRLDPNGVATRTQIDNITAVYRKWLTGAQMSDAERKSYERFLPAPSDNADIVLAKLQNMRNSIERKNNVILDGAYTNYYNAPTPQPTRQTTTNKPTTKSSYPDGTIIKNKQGQRMIMRNGQWQQI